MTDHLTAELLDIARTHNEALRWKAQCAIAENHIASLVAENKSLKAQLRACGKRPITDYVVSHSR